MYKTCF